MTDQPNEGEEPRSDTTPTRPVPPGQSGQPGPPQQGPPSAQQPPPGWPQQPPPSWQQGPPYGRVPPHGPYGPAYVQPAPTGLPTWAQIVLGGLIGLLASVGSPLVAFGLAGIDAPVEVLVLLVTVIPPLLASPLLIARATRSWGVGIMLGLALGSLVLGGACVSLLTGY